jgi:DNA end-binding protein Ku
MAALRPYWKGYLRLSLVNIAVELYTATSQSSHLRLNMIHKPSGKRIRYQKIAEGVGPVKADDIVKGYEVGDDEYVLLTDEELDEIRLESRRTINMVQFVDQCEIDPRYYEKPYYVVPADNEVAQEGFAVIVKALRDAEKTALGQLSARGRDYIVAIRPCGRGLLAETLRYADEVRASDEIFADIPDVRIDPEMTNLAEELIERRSGPFKPDAFSSGYRDALRDLIEEKQKKGTITAKPAAKTADSGKVVDLMEALRRSLDDEKKKNKKKKPRRSGRSKAA